MNTSRWQFSIRGLLLLTALVSAALAVFVNVPGIVRVVLTTAAAVFVVIAVIQSANFATSDQRPLLAAISWALLAVFFAAFCAAIVRPYLMNAESSDSPGGFVFFSFAVMAACCLTCLFRAGRSLL
jgi:hypothetical protein